MLLLFSQSFLFLTQSECLSADSTAGYMSSEASEAANVSVVQEQLEKKISSETDKIQDAHK